MGVSASLVSISSGRRTAPRPSAGGARTSPERESICSRTVRSGSASRRSFGRAIRKETGWVLDPGPAWAEEDAQSETPEGEIRGQEAEAEAQGQEAGDPQHDGDLVRNEGGCSMFMPGTSRGGG